MIPQSIAQTAWDGLGEAELVDLARQGHCEAFRVIIQRCNQRLFRVARAIVQNEAEAEEIVQDVYLRAFAALDTFRGDAAILTWLTRIALNEAFGRLRTSRRTVNLDPKDEIQPAADVSDAEGPEAHAARLQIGHLIERAIDNLPPQFRVVFVMREIENCSIRETADLLGIPPETVKTRLHRARQRLRAALDEKIGGAKEAFPFLGIRCRRMTEAVLEQLTLPTERADQPVASNAFA